MRVMVMVKATTESEAGKLPERALLAAMGDMIQDDPIARALPHSGADEVEPLRSQRGDHRGAVSLGRMAR